MELAMPATKLGAKFWELWRHAMQVSTFGARKLATRMMELWRHAMQVSTFGTRTSAK
jgi:hypothetical protein